MIYAFSLLILLLGLVICVPAVRKLMYMSSIKRNGVTTRGNVICIKSAMNTMGWLDLGVLRAVEIINQDRPLVSYQSPQGHEMRLDVIPSNFLLRRKYVTGEPVEVAYDQTEPGRAYLIREWSAAVRDVSIGGGLLFIAVLLWVAGRVYNLPL